jgi:hypothetical protein
MADAVKRLPLIDRRRCRSAFEERFTADRMARDYVALYERIIEESTIQTAPKIRAIGSRHSNGSAFEGRQHEMARGIGGSRHV